MDNTKCQIPIDGDTEFSARNYIPGNVENAFVFVRTDETDDDSLNGIYENGTIIINTNSAVLDGNFGLNPKIISKYPRCIGKSADDNFLKTTFTINLGTNFSI